MRPFLSLIWKTEDNRRSVNMSGLVTCAFGSISLKSIFTRALVRSQGIVTLSIHITTVCSVQTLIYVWDNKMNTIRAWRLFRLAVAARIFVFTRAFPVVRLEYLPVQFVLFPWYPFLHLQQYDPMVLLHVVLPSQLCLPDKHSSMSIKGKRRRWILSKLVSLKIFIFYVFI